jgi:hypothetical protein
MKMALSKASVERAGDAGGQPSGPAAPQAQTSAPRPAPPGRRPRPQAHNQKAGKQVVPLGMLVRPWATQFSVPGFRPQDWPPGSSHYVRSKAKTKC